jgi:hypothetical protein
MILEISLPWSLPSDRLAIKLHYASYLGSCYQLPLTLLLYRKAEKSLVRIGMFNASMLHLQHRDRPVYRSAPYH